jgi:hypothetical protein
MSRGRGGCRFNRQRDRRDAPLLSVVERDEGTPDPDPPARPMLAETEASNPNRASLTATITPLFSNLAALSPGAGVHRGRGL